MRQMVLRICAPSSPRSVLVSFRVPERKDVREGRDCERLVLGHQDVLVNATPERVEGQISSNSMLVVYQLKNHNSDLLPWCRNIEV